MAEIYEIKRRVDGLKSIHNITYAMQIVTISRLKRITNQLLKIRESVTDLKSVLHSLQNDNPKFRQELMDIEVDATLPPVFVLFFSNRGFCGSFNQDIYNQFITFCKQQNLAPESVEKLCVGKKGEFFIKPNTPKTSYFYPSKDLFSSKDVQDLYAKVSEYIQNRRQIYFVHFQFKSIVTQKLIVEPFYPIVPNEFDDVPAASLIPQYIEPVRKTAEQKSKDQYFYLKLFKTIWDSSCSEFGQRFMLMKSAVDNVKNLTDELMLELNKERQRMITQEISEIISTFKALQKV